MAECSESAGSSRLPLRSSSGKTTGPAAISVSLLARARSLPARIAARVGSRPAQPTMPVTTSSALDQAATSQIPSRPPSNWGSRGGRWLGSRAASRSCSSPSRLGSARATASGAWRWICSTSSARLLPALRATTRKRSGNSATMSRVWVPMEPVEPSTAMAFKVRFPGGDGAPVCHRP